MLHFQSNTTLDSNHNNKIFNEMTKLQTRQCL